MDLRSPLSPSSGNQFPMGFGKHRKWVAGISIGVILIIILALVGQFGGLIGARLIRQGSPRLTVYQNEEVTLEIPSSVSVQKLEICDDKETRMLFGYRDFKSCSTLTYFVKPGTTQVTARIPAKYEGRAVVVVRSRGTDNRLLTIAPRDAKIALWVNKARAQLPVQQASSGGDSGGGGDGGSSDGGGSSSGGSSGSGDGGSSQPAAPSVVAHISYQELSYPNQYLKYATNNSDTWVATRIAEGTYMGIGTALGVDSQEKIHIAFNESNPTTSWLKYATNASGSWVTTTIDSAGGTTGISQGAITFDSTGKVYIVYRKSGSGIMWATNVSGSWVTASGPAVGGCEDVVLDAQNKLHLACVTYDSSRGTEKVQYATNASGSWVITDVEYPSSGSSYYYPRPTLKLDAQGKAHMSYLFPTTTTPNRQLKYATNSSGPWVTEVVDSAVYFVDSDISSHNDALALDAQGKVHISYFDRNPNSLNYATNISGSWVTTTVDSSGLVGKHNSLVLDSNDKAHISYFDDGNSDLKYATNMSGSWVITVAESDGTVGQWTSIGVSQ